MAAPMNPSEAAGSARRRGSSQTSPQEDITSRQPRAMRPIPPPCVVVSGNAHTAERLLRWACAIGIPIVVIALVVWLVVTIGGPGLP